MSSSSPQGAEKHYGKLMASAPILENFSWKAPRGNFSSNFRKILGLANSALQRQWLQHLPVRRQSWVFRARVDLLAEWDGAVAQERPQRAGLARTESIERGRVCPPGRRGRSVESQRG